VGLPSLTPFQTRFRVLNLENLEEEFTPDYFDDEYFMNNNIIKKYK
jgi:hypothetical protein